MEQLKNKKEGNSMAQTNLDFTISSVYGFTLQELEELAKAKQENSLIVKPKEEVDVDNKNKK